MDPSQGYESYDLAERKQLRGVGFTPCINPACAYMHAPGLYEQNCPKCETGPEHLYDVIGDSLFESPGGSTRVGLSMKAQGDLGEELVKSLGELPGYGPITWWSEEYTSPLDGACGEWGIEVKSANVDNAAVQFNIGADEKITKNAAAAQAGYKGILAILVVFDYRRSVADIYGREFTLAPWGRHPTTRQELSGLGFYRANKKYRLLEEIPFQNPFMTPTNPQPTPIPF